MSTITWLSLPFAVFATACGSSRGSGTCPDKPVVEMCSPEFRYECETTRDGCEQCSCVPISDDQGRPFHTP